MIRSAIPRRLVAPALVAGLFVSYLVLDPAALALAVLSLGAGVLVRLAFRARPESAPRVFALSAILGNVLIALINVYAFDYVVILLMAFLAFVSTSLSLGAGAVWVAGLSRSRLATASAWVAVACLGLLPISMVFTLWPLKGAFAWSRASMERLADRMAAGEALGSPVWAGFYRVVEARREPGNGNVALLIDATPGSRTGFVRVADPHAPYGPLMGLECDIPVGGRWRYQLEH